MSTFDGMTRTLNRHDIAPDNLFKKIFQLSIIIYINFNLNKILKLQLVLKGESFLG